MSVVQQNVIKSAIIDKKKINNTSTQVVRCMHGNVYEGIQPYTSRLLCDSSEIYEKKFADFFKSNHLTMLLT